MHFDELLGTAQSLAPLGYFTMGAGFVRLSALDAPWQQDDLAVVLSHGGDWSPQPLTLHRRLASGSFEKDPSWFSSDYDHHVGLAVGALTDSGFEDVVVAVLAGRDGKVSGGGVKIYYGTSHGLDPNPVWVARGFAASGLALADLHGTGRLDIVIAALWEGGALRQHLTERENAFDGRIRILRNSPAAKGSASFKEERLQQRDTIGSADVKIQDVDLDGEFDLICAGPRTVVAFGTPGAPGDWSNADLWRSFEAHPFSFTARAFPVPGRYATQVVASSRGLFSISQLLERGLSAPPFGIFLHLPERGGTGAAFHVFRSDMPSHVPAGFEIVSYGDRCCIAAGFLPADGSLTSGAPAQLFEIPSSNLPWHERAQTIATARLMASAVATAPLTFEEGSECSPLRVVTTGIGQRVVTFPPGRIGLLSAVRVLEPGGRSVVVEPHYRSRPGQRSYARGSGIDSLSFHPPLPANSEVVVESKRAATKALVVASSAAWPPVGATKLWTST